MKKRVVSLLLALVMMTSLLPTGVWAEDAYSAAPDAVPQAVQQEEQGGSEESEQNEEPVLTEEPQADPASVEGPAEELAEEPVMLTAASASADTGSASASGSIEKIEITSGDGKSSVCGVYSVEDDAYCFVVPDIWTISRVIIATRGFPDNTNVKLTTPNKSGKLKNNSTTLMGVMLSKATLGKEFETTLTVDTVSAKLKIIRAARLNTFGIYTDEALSANREVALKNSVGDKYNKNADTECSITIPKETAAVWLNLAPFRGSKPYVKVLVNDQVYSEERKEIDLNSLTWDEEGSSTIPIDMQYTGSDGLGESTHYTLKINRVNCMPEFTIHPQSMEVEKGADVTLRAEAKCEKSDEGFSLQYQWYSGSAYDRNSEKAIEGATGETLKIDTAKACDVGYSCHVTNRYNGKDYTQKSDYAVIKTKLSTITPAVITEFSGGGECIEGEEKLTLKVSFTNEDALNYVIQKIEWYRNAENSTSGGKRIRTVEGQNSDTFTPKGESTGTYYYYCVVTLSDKSSVAPSVMTKSEGTLQIIYKPYGSIITLPGAGTEANPYKIRSLADLETVRSLVEQGYSLQNQNFLLMEDIALPVDWKPIGKVKGQDASFAINDVDEKTQGTIYDFTGKGINLLPFSGKLNGGGHTISVAEGGLPLFGVVRSAEVKNLNIFGKKIASYGLIHNYTVDYGTDGDYNTGCPNTVVIDHVTLKSGSSTLHSGFIGGYASGANTVEIRNSLVEKGVVIGYDSNRAESGLNQSIGSFAGDFNGTITNCTSYATVNGVNYVGGLVGRKGQSMGSCVVQNSQFHGTVNASGDWAGGILACGYYASSAPNTPIATVKNCLVVGTINGNEYVGGIFGGEPVCEDCWANGAGGIRDNVFFGTLTAHGNYKGGIIGFMKSVNEYVTIVNNYFLDSCGADKAVGGVEIIDDKDFTDARCGVAATAKQMSDGSVVERLNASESSFKNWAQGTDHPVISDVAIAYELIVGGEIKNQHYVGDALNLTGLTLTAKWSDGTTTNVPLNDPDLKITGYDSGKHGQQTVTLQYGAAKVEIVVTVLDKEPEDITVTITLLGDKAHGDNGQVHGLSKGGLTAWVSGHKVKVTTNMTVWDALKQLPGVTWDNPTGNYIKSVTYGGVTIGEFTNGKNSGWMYTLNGKYPMLGVSEQYLKKGDVIVFHYTDDYTLEAADMGPAPEEKKTADEVIALINAIGVVDLTKGDVIAKARAAYDALSAADKKLVTNYQTLLDAEAAYAKLVAELGKKADSIYKTTGDYLAKLGTPSVGSIGGEWMALGLARSGRTVPEGYYDAVVKYVKDNIDSNGRLDKNKATENARIILALTAIGKDVTNVDGHDLLAGLNEMSYLSKQGINGAIFTLIALDSHSYTPAGDVTRDKLVQVILDAQISSDGGWSLDGKNADVDMTAMAIQALAAYYKSNSSAKKAVDKGLSWLSSVQQNDGGFTSWGAANSESCAQVIVALTALGIDPAKDSRFIKNGVSVLDALCSFAVNGGGFKHLATETSANGMATEQGFYALVAYYRLLNGQTSLYDMADVKLEGVKAEEPVDDTDKPDDATDTDTPVDTEVGEASSGGQVVLWVVIGVVAVGGIAALAVTSKKRHGRDAE